MRPVYSRVRKDANVFDHVRLYSRRLDVQHDSASLPFHAYGPQVLERSS